MTEAPGAPPQIRPPKPTLREHPITKFNLEQQDFQVRRDVVIPYGLTPTDTAAQRREHADPNVVNTEVYEDKKTGQKLNTVWIYKEKAENPDQPVVLMINGIGTHLSHPDMSANALQVSHAVKDAPVFMVDYPNVPDASGLTREQKTALKDDNVEPIIRTWVDAMKEKGIGDKRKVYILGESMGGFYGVELALYLANHPELGIDVSKLHIIDPGGVHTYKNKREVFDSLQYLGDFMSDAKEGQIYKDALTNEFLRESGGHNVSSARAMLRDANWLLNRGVRERPPTFYYGSVLAHGGLPDKLSRLLELNKKMDLTVSNYTNSKVCPHDECAEMVRGLEEKPDREGRVSANYLPGDRHPAILLHDRMAFYTGMAFRERAPAVNPERAVATRSVVDTLSKRIYERYNVPQDPRERREYHNMQHTNQVRAASRKILESILSDRDITDPEKERLMGLMDIAATAHDSIQNSTSGNQPGDSEYESIREVLALMDEENQSAGHDIFNTEDKDIIVQSISATIPTITDGMVDQEHLLDTASPVARSLAIADVYYQYMFPGTLTSPALFRERNYDILEHLFKDGTIGEPNDQESVKNRMGAWIAQEYQFTDYMKAALPGKIAMLPAAEQEKIQALMKFDEGLHDLKHFDQEFQSLKDANNINLVLRQWGYFEESGRYITKKPYLT